MMNRPPALRTSSASALMAGLYWAYSSSNRFRTARIFSSLVSPWPSASVSRSSTAFGSASCGFSGSSRFSQKCSLRIWALAMNSALPPSMISVPRPAMLVAMVMAPFLPACATISASRSWFLAFRTLKSRVYFCSILASVSLFSTLTVPTRTGWPFLWHSSTCSMTALYLPLTVL